ncbi:hypothetical protein [Pseudomonas sp. F01002]|uniref:hypothetical protein n=1 Tax=Pseudomonas sp. F01002 TaxID=2555724 RepID=UPI00106DCE1E|nr:hypothetical protein [Pseudomonas sp. F01002]TFB37868.1 hypothetical protein E3W21_19435 [Pseudomonas sp. F01002]
MFKTTERSAIFPAPSGPDGVQFWHHVEHEVHWPWYYLKVVQDFGDEEMRTMLMVSTASDLADIVSARTDSVWLEEAYIVTPGSINESGSWKLESLLEVVVLRNERCFPAEVCHVVTGGQIYKLGQSPCLQSVKPQKIFDALIHLGKGENKNHHRKKGD